VLNQEESTKVCLTRNRYRKEGKIVTPRSATPNERGLPLGETEVEASNLDQRREKLQAMKRAVAATATNVGLLDKKLDKNAAQHRTHEAGLQTALDRVATLKKTLKASKRARDKLRAARKDARRAAAKTAHRADTAEAKYDRAVLADILRRQKVADTLLHTDESTVSVTDPGDLTKSGTTTRPRSET
jgi:chromosome segregation ATPase